MTLGVGMNLDLDLGRSARLLRAVIDGIDTAELGTYLGYHKSMVASIRSWARHIGLLSHDGQLTEPARRLIDLDPDLSQPATAMTLYYWLARNDAAEAFHYLVNHFLYDASASNRSFSLADARVAAARAGVGAHSRAKKQLDREIGLMLNALRRRQGFGPLGLVSRGADGYFRVHPPSLAPAFVAYAVYHDWSDGSATMRFHEIEQPSHLGRVCLLPRPALVNALRAAEQAGFLKVEEEAQFDRVSRLSGWNAPKLQSMLYVDN